MCVCVCACVCVCVCACVRACECECVWVCMGVVVVVEMGGVGRASRFGGGGNLAQCSECASPLAMAGAHYYVGYVYGYVVKVYTNGIWQPLSGRHYRFRDDAELECARHQSANPRHHQFGWLYRTMFVYYRCYRVADQIGEYVWA